LAIPKWSVLPDTASGFNCDVANAYKPIFRDQLISSTEDAFLDLLVSTIET
jgi:hypothetical protein